MKRTRDKIVSLADFHLTGFTIRLWLENMRDDHQIHMRSLQKMGNFTPHFRTKTWRVKYLYALLTETNLWLEPKPSGLPKLRSNRQKRKFLVRPKRPPILILIICGLISGTAWKLQDSEFEFPLEGVLPF